MKISPSEAKEIVLAKRAAGVSVKDAMQAVGRSYETWKDWRKNDATFKDRADKINAALQSGDKATSEVPDFPEFCERYLYQALPHHHLRAWDVLNGREPRDLRDSMEFQRGAGDADDETVQVIMNFPPEHAKSTVWGVQYAAWRIAKDPNVRIAFISNGQNLTKKFLFELKEILDRPDMYPELHAAFAPTGGWRSTDKAEGLAWRENMIYVRGRTKRMKDPTVEALSMGSRIYGTRFDVMILDDIEDENTASQYEAHGATIGQTIYSRLDKKTGVLLVLGTRVAVMDIYRHLRDNAKDEFDRPFYTYFAQPAVLDGYPGPSADWEVLWPEHMPPRSIAKAKASMPDPRRFEFVYQQSDVSDEATFPAECVDGAVNQRRFHGVMTPGAPGHRREGNQGLYVVASWDPASSAGCNAMIVMGVDKREGIGAHRWVLDVWNKRGAVPRITIQLLKDWTVKYSVNEWRIEKNAVQQFITQLPEIRDFLTAHGARLVEHQTTNNKWDPIMGVEGTLVPLILPCAEEIGDRLVAVPSGTGPICFPAPRRNPNVKTLTEQLKRWDADNKKQVQDLVMALWFAELGVRQYLRGGLGQQTHTKSKYVSRGAIARRGVYRFDQVESVA